MEAQEIGGLIVLSLITLGVYVFMAGLTKRYFMRALNEPNPKHWFVVIVALLWPAGWIFYVLIWLIAFYAKLFCEGKDVGDKLAGGHDNKDKNSI